MPQPFLDYRTPAPQPPKPRKVIRSLLLILFGVPITLYFGIGSLFVEGGREQGDPSVGPLSVVFVGMLAIIGITMIAFGIWELGRGGSKSHNEDP
jgi:hypothetical protein